MKRAAPKWPTEAAMFARFVAHHRDLGFRIYPESCGHDLVMVAPDPLPDAPMFTAWGALRPGDTIVVEGKLRPSLHLLWQAVTDARKYPPSRWVAENRPARSAHWYVALTPDSDFRFTRLAAALGVCVATCPAPEPEGSWRRPNPPGATYVESLRIEPAAPLDLPSVEVDITPGQPAPKAVTKWKVAAVKLCLLGRDGDTLTAGQVGGLARAFIEKGWLKREGRGKAATFRLVEHHARPDHVYPEIVDALAAQAVAK